MSKYYKELGIDEEKLRKDFQEIRQNHPNAWVYLREMADVCPPPYYEYKIDDVDNICWQGCRICWENYLKGKNNESN